MNYLEPTGDSNFRDTVPYPDEIPIERDGLYTDPTAVSEIEDAIEKGYKDELALKYAQFIREKMYGGDVRECIARFGLWLDVRINEIEKQNLEVIAEYKEIKSLMIYLQNQFDDVVANVTVDSEVILARRPKNKEPFKTLGARLDNYDDFLDHYETEKAVAIQTESKSEFSNVGRFIPLYYQERLKELAAKIDPEKFNINHHTDPHVQMSSYAPNSLSHISHSAELTRIADIDVSVHNGDNINGWYGKEQIEVETNMVTKTAFNRSSFDTDVFFNFGNHDTGAFQNGKTKLEQCLSLDQIKNFYMTQDCIYGEQRNGDSFYCYKDYEGQKIRVILINAFDLPETINSDGTYQYNFLEQSCFGGEQLKWLAEEALILPASDWQVIIFSHAGISGCFQDIPQYNTHELIDILQAFQNGNRISTNNVDNEFPVVLESDFSKQGKGTLIAIVSSHMHADGIKNFDGIMCVQTAGSLCGPNDEGRFANTETEDLWDVLSIDTNKKHVNIYRFGYGEDREFDY